MDVSLVKTSKTEFNSKTFDLKTEEGQVFKLPPIFVDYSQYILNKTNRNSGTNSSYFYQNIYFPMMLELGYGNYDKYTVYNNKFDQENNPGWNYITVKVSYIKDPKIDPKLVRELSIKHLNLKI
jgi:hypothetical protein